MDETLKTRISSLIEENPDLADFAGPIPQELISEAERRLGITLPEDYRWFVSEYGCGEFGSCEIYGLTKSGSHSSVPSVVFATETAREEGAPDHLVPFWYDGDDIQYALDLNRVSNGECAVVEWISGLTADEQEFPVVSRGFLQCLLELMSEQVDLD